MMIMQDIIVIILLVMMILSKIVPVNKGHILVCLEDWTNRMFEEAQHISNALVKAVNDEVKKVETILRKVEELKAEQKRIVCEYLDKKGYLFLYVEGMTLKEAEQEVKNVQNSYVFKNNMTYCL